ncbi:MAG: hypothetical protein ACTSYF_17690 [Promethearchaeota archaeon]
MKIESSYHDEITNNLNVIKNNSKNTNNMNYLEDINKSFKKQADERSTVKIIPVFEVQKMLTLSRQIE